MKAVALALLVAAAAPVQTPPPALEAMRQALGHAAAAHDRAALASLMAFPLALDNYGSPNAVGRAEFARKSRYFTIIFGGGDAGLADCIATAAISMQSDRKAFGGRAWVVDCNGNEYYFGQRDGAWKLVAYQNINE